MVKKQRNKWICEECRRKNEPDKKKCVYCNSPKRKTLAQLEKQLDTIFSIYIRERDKHRCVTCGAHASDAGHYISRSNRLLRWDEHNVNAQCRRCNNFLSGNLSVYSMYILNHYGEETLRELHEKSRKTFKPSRAWLIEMIDKYKCLIDNLS